MAAYVSLPSNCEAFQWFEKTGCVMGVVGYSDVEGFYVVTVHGQRTTLADGDFVVTEPTAPTKHYPVKPEIFVKRWTPKT